MSLHERLCSSARRWATTALDAYVEDPPDHDFAVHHMAVAVEHLSKAYLCSISEVLLVAERYELDDLLILAGQGGRAKRQWPNVKTIGLDVASSRVEKVLGKKPAGFEGLHRLREVRNGVTHLGLGEAPSEVRARLATGIVYLNGLLTELAQSTTVFWGAHEPLTARLVEQTVTERQLRYESKLRRAREIFERRLSGMPEWQRAEAITSMSSIPHLYGLALHGLAVSVTCPACGSPALARGKEYSEVHEEGFTLDWFSPEYFRCAVCELTLEGDALDGGELELAGITGHYLSDHEEEDSDWEP